VVQPPSPNTAPPLNLICCCTTLFFSILLCTIPLHAAAETNTDSTERTIEPRISLLEPLDSTRNAVSYQVTEFANWLDNFFGDERIYDESQNSSIKLNLLQINEEGHQPRYEANLQGKLTLPNTQKRLELLFESDPEENTNADNTVVEAVEAQEQSLGLRYIQLSTDWLRANTDVGASATGICAPPKPCSGVTQPAPVQPHGWISNAGLPKPGCSAPPAKSPGWTKPASST